MPGSTSAIDFDRLLGELGYSCEIVSNLSLIEACRVLTCARNYKLAASNLLHVSLPSIMGKGLLLVRGTNFVKIALDAVKIGLVERICGGGQSGGRFFGGLLA